MNASSILREIAIFVFGLAAVICAVLSIYSSSKTDRRQPYIEARKKSLKKGYLFLALCLGSLMIMAGFLEPSNIWTFDFCFIGGLLIFSIGYGFSYLQLKYIGKNESARKLFSREKDDNGKN